MKTVSVTDLQQDVTHYLELAEGEEVFIVQDGKLIGFLRGFADEDDLFDYQLERDPRFLERVRQSRMQLREGQHVRLEDLRAELFGSPDPE